MTSNNGLQVTRSCLDCQIRILSDEYLIALDSFDWQQLVFLVRYQGVGRPNEYSVIAFLWDLVYMELAGITSVRLFCRMLEGNYYKLNILGLDRLPYHSLFSRYKKRLAYPASYGHFKF